MRTWHILGGCFCGAVRYEATVPPLGSMVCHCQSCRRLTAAPVVAWLTFPKDSFRFTSTAPAAMSSSAGVVRCFCTQCGTHLSYKTSDSDEAIDISTCSLDDPEAFPPTHHSWLSHDLGWVQFGDGRPTFPRSRHDASG